MWIYRLFRNRRCMQQCLQMQHCSQANRANLIAGCLDGNRRKKKGLYKTGGARSWKWWDDWRTRQEKIRGVSFPSKLAASCGNWNWFWGMKRQNSNSQTGQESWCWFAIDSEFECLHTLSTEWWDDNKTCMGLKATEMTNTAIRRSARVDVALNLFFVFIVFFVNAVITTFDQVCSIVVDVIWVYSWMNIEKIDDIELIIQNIWYIFTAWNIRNKWQNNLRIYDIYRDYLNNRK